MRICVLFLFIFTLGVSEAKETSSITRKLRYTALGSSFLAITSDWFVEYYYGKYKEAEFPGECVKYRWRTQFCETMRDVSICTAALSLIGSIVSEKFTKKLGFQQGFLNKFHFKLYHKGALIYYEI